MTEVLEEFRRSVQGVVARAAAARPPAPDPWQPDPEDTELWRQAGDLGWTGLMAAEELGGAGAGLAAAVVVAEELAAGLASVPFLSSAVLAVTAFELAGDEDQRARWVPALAAGRVRGAAALTGPTGRPGAAHLTVTAEPDGDRWALRGSAGLVLDGAGADVLVVTARTPSGAALFSIRPGGGVDAVERLSVDRTRRVADLTFAGAAAERLPGGTGVLAAIVERASLVVAADACGAARQALELAVAYAKEREQFGRAIGSFQAVKHKLADMYVALEGARLAVHEAAAAIDAGDPSALRRSAVARAYGRDAATKVAGDAIQVHGGIGYTWEHPCHRLWKRTKFDELFLGDPSVARAELAADLLPTW